jgi:hypothetical protein
LMPMGGDDGQKILTTGAAGDIFLKTLTTQAEDRAS